ncbi:MAG TPA: citrate/2-methylcitrate synthase, partial [Ktedonobacterales bacterium]
MSAPKGLEGIVVAQTAISHVFGTEGRLVYRGYNINELAGKASYEEVAFLLWNGHLPTQSELAEMNAKMRPMRKLTDDGYALRALKTGNVNPMDALRTEV